jgi:hypothetical protein
VLHEVKQAGFQPRGAWPWRRWVFCAGRRRAQRGLAASAFARAEALQREQAICVLEDAPRRYWWCCDRFWWEDEDLSARDVLALAHERRMRGRRRLERAHTALGAASTAGASRNGRVSIAREVKLAVFARDGGRCVQCGARFELQYDHVIPLALGGASTVENLQILCAPCNAAKGAAL